MTHSNDLARRTVLGAIMSTAALPSRALSQQRSDPASQKASTMKIKMTFGDQMMTATLYDNASARDFFSMLPLDLQIDDYADNEKISYLPRKLTEAGSGPFANERAGDVCYYAPWGNLALFHGGYRYSRGLIRLGRLEGGFEPLFVRGEFPLRVEPI
jgi:hypothetical protein